MGDPRKQRKKFSKPGHPWQRERILAEKEILKQYGLKRKNEIWKMTSMLQKFLHRAKTIIAQTSPQSEIEKRQLLARLHSLGLLKQDSRIEDVLNLTLKDIMERRLQTLLCRKNIAPSMMHARQFITHEHVAIGAKKITVPSYLVLITEEPNIKLVRAFNVQAAAPQKDEKAEKSE